MGLLYLTIVQREKVIKRHGYELHRSHNQWGKKSKGIRDGRRKCFLSRRPPISDFRLTKDRRMQCNKFTLISHKFKLCIFFAYWKDNSFVPGQHPRTFACKWDGKWCWGWSWDGAGELGARSYTLVHLSEPWYPRVGDAKHHLTPVAPYGSLFLARQKRRRLGDTFQADRKSKSPRCPSTPACLTKERESHTSKPLAPPWPTVLSSWLKSS